GRPHTAYAGAKSLSSAPPGLMGYSVQHLDISRCSSIVHTKNVVDSSKAPKKMYPSMLMPRRSRTLPLLKDSPPNSINKDSESLKLPIATPTHRRARKNRVILPNAVVALSVGLSS